ncbi:hypothetical protein C0989_002154 [Termitomyces sp. Mn162]|nr:hypothetical protein C0989_002154 [Termitomyces sp. Mn162]
MTTTQSLSGSPSPSQSVRPSKKFSNVKTQDSIGPTVELRIGWMPQDPAVVNRWLSKKIEQAGEKDESFAEVIQKFQKFIENDASILILFQQMFNQVPTTPPYDKDTWGNPSVSIVGCVLVSKFAHHLYKVRDYKTMLRLFNSLLTEAPVFTTKHASLAFPINAILQWPMGTPAGKALFQIPSVNEQFCNVLNERGKYLSSPASAHVLNTEPGGWLSDEALKAMGGFTDDFIHDTSKPHWGFTSWDDFFTRRFKEGIRPVPAPYDSRIVTNPCEGGVYNIAHNVLEHDTFWIKENAYSLADMLANHEFVTKFVGGTVYQTWLSALSYHRWHSPVTGTVVDIDFVPGTYYSSSPTVGMSPLALRNSQGYLTSVATRVNIYMHADNPDIGLICFMGVGMAEVSSVEVQVKKGERIIQGQETGMFHFGGSTSCLIFRPETKIKFMEDVNSKVGDMANIIKVNTPIGCIEA